MRWPLVAPGLQAWLSKGNSSTMSNHMSAASRQHPSSKTSGYKP